MEYLQGSWNPFHTIHYSKSNIQHENQNNNKTNTQTNKKNLLIFSNFDQHPSSSLSADLNAYRRYFI